MYLLKPPIASVDDLTVEDMGGGELRREDSGGVMNSSGVKDKERERRGSAGGIYASPSPKSALPSISGKDLKKVCDMTPAPSRCTSSNLFLVYSYVVCLFIPVVGQS